MSEKTLHKAVCDYLRLQYPNVLFNSDLSGSMKLTIGQATAMKRLRSNRGFPDLCIYEPRTIDYGYDMIHSYHGLFIELKKEGEKIYKKNGDFTTPHIEEQDGVIHLLRERGYKADFAVGFNEAKALIDLYLKR